MTDDRIRDVRASVVDAVPGADYHDREGGHWIVDGDIATPMSRWPEYRGSRTSWGIDVLGSFVVEVEDGRGNVGVGVSTGGVPACYIVERHLARFVIGRVPGDHEDIWDRLYAATLYYGRRGLAVNAISAVDLAIWDLHGRQRAEPVHELLGGKVRARIPCYATGPRAEVAMELGFVGAKLPLPAGPAEDEAGMLRNVALVERSAEAVGDSLFLALDCYMALDVPYALQLFERLRPYGLRWIEECLPPDDYWGYAELRRQKQGSTWLTTGEHEATRWGFRLLAEMGCADVLQPDVMWAGGLTELLRIAQLADEHGIRLIPHGSSVYSYHLLAARPSGDLAEFLMLSPDGTEIVPMLAPLLLGEPVPERGRVSVADAPGFGVELDRSLPLRRPHRAADR